MFPELSINCSEYRPLVTNRNNGRVEAELSFKHSTVHQRRTLLEVHFRCVLIDTWDLGFFSHVLGVIDFIRVWVASPSFLASVQVSKHISQNVQKWYDKISFVFFFKAENGGEMF